ncbi:MAG TPA: histidine phosphatase family protein [Gaiellaceae bacterium]|nr:histidine phosphatase family protein [Gaiellaceae bacterium]
MRVFLLARHGQSLFNVDGVVNGDPLRDRGLSERGIEEAERLGAQISPVGVDVVLLSPFPRAVQTANIALARREVPHELDEELGDIRLGDLEGWSVADYRAYKCHGDRDLRFPGGESLNDAALRYAGAYERLLARSERVTLVVCHEIPVRYAVNAANGSDQLDAPFHEIANAAPYVFDEDRLRRAVERMRELAAFARAAPSH